MAIEKKYLFKLTPNKRDVVINTSILLHGYEDVEYPIPIIDTEKLGYVYDPDSFLFKDSETVKYDYPYPVKMEIEAFFEDLPFYGLNNSMSYCNIRYNDIKPFDSYGDKIDANTYNNFLHSSSDKNQLSTYDSEYDGSYDVGIFENADTNIDIIPDQKSYTLANYKIKVKVFWSDNKAHATDSITNNPNTWREINEKTGTYPFVLRIIPETYKLINDDGTDNKLKFWSGNSKELLLPNLEYNYDNKTYIQHTNIFTVPDNFTFEKRNVVKFKIDATFTDPKTLMSVSAYTEVVVKQNAHIGYKQKYRKIKFIDYKPVDIWSPVVYASYNKDNNITYKIDKDTKLDYYYFFVKGTLDISSSLYKKEKYFPNGIYYQNAISDITQNQEDNTNSNDKKVPTIKIDNKFLCDSLVLGHYCLNLFEYPYTYIDSNILDSSDYDTFKNRFNECFKIANILNNYYNVELFSSNLIFNKDNLKNDVSLYAFARPNTNSSFIFNSSFNNKVFSGADVYENKIPYSFSLLNSNDTSTYGKELDSQIDLKKGQIVFDSSYRAVYQRYFIDEQYYYPINASFILGDINDKKCYIPIIDKVGGKYGYINDSSKDFDISSILHQYDNDSNKLDIKYNIATDSSIYDHKVIQDNEGHSIETKFCINSLLNNDTNIQIPRFGVYPVFSGYIAYNSSVYDFTDKNKIEYDNGNDEIIPNLMIRKNGLLTINTNVLYNNIDDIKKNQSINTFNIKNNNQIKLSYVDSQPLFFGTSIIKKTYNYKIKINSSKLIDYIRINGLKYKDLTNGILYSDIEPGIFTLSLSNDYSNNLSESINFTIETNHNLTDGKNDIINGELLVTNDENEKHLINYSNKGYELNTQHHSSMLLRANPKLSGNIKLVVDKNYNLYLDTFKANAILNNKNVRKYPISSEGNYPRDIKKVFSKIPIKSIFGLPENSLKAHKVYTDYKDQYETMYEYGAETNTDSLYSENMKILAPLHIGNDVPEFFAIFRYDDIFNEETYSGEGINDNEKIKELIKKSKVIKTFDLRTTTSIGQYLNNYKNMLSNYGQCYLQFIELDYNLNSPYYRQGNNIWKGISVDRGILVNQSETTYFGSKILNSDIVNKQEMFNNYIIAGFERHNLIYSNIINLEFMFDDNDMEEYSMHRYFGLYLTANDFINYGYVVSSKNSTGNTVLTKYNKNGDIYKGDLNIYKVIFNEKYYDRLFFAITNNNVARVLTDIDLKTFFKNYVTNTPDSNLMSLDSSEILIDNDTDKSFIILHFNKPIECGEHIKFIALDYPIKSSVTDAGNTYETNKLTTEHVVYEIIASNDDRLLETDYNINPYVAKLKCRYSENTYFYRISFYSLDLEYNDITASLDVLINRIIKCIEKFNTDIIKVGSYNDKSISIISSYDNMYVQHILAPKFDDFHYDYFGFDKVGGVVSSLYTTNREYNYSISFIKHNDIKYIENDIQPDDNENDWIKNIDNNKEHNYLNNIGDLHCYVESEDPVNIKDDTISYFNSNITYEMHALTNQSDYFDNYYCAFSNYCFETLGWRYNNVVKFKSTKELNYVYSINTDISDLVNKIKYPLIYNTNGIYDTANVFNITNGYLRNNVWEPDNYKNYSLDNQLLFINKTLDLCVITNPYDVNTCMISTINPSLLITNKIHLYKPTEVSVAIMGITNIKDIDTTIDLSRTLHNEDNLYIDIPAGESIATDESDYRIQYGIMYEVISGKLKFNKNTVLKGCKFIVTANNIYISTTANLMTKTTPYISVVNNTKLKIIDKQKYLTYNYDTVIPELKSNNYFANPNNTNNSELLWPIVPLTQCLWKSNGLYYDNNNILDVNTLNESYEVKGNFCENVYTASDYDTNQYVTNKIDNILYINNESVTYKESILNCSIQHSIKKLLIDNVNIETASAYYNSNIKSLEFIFSGIKFNIKLNTKVVNSYIHLEDYSGFEAFVLTDYDLAKTNEFYISLKEKFILLINHQFYIDYEHEGTNNIKDVTDGEYQSYADYSVLSSPYDIDFRTITCTNNGIIAHKKNNFHKKLLSIIDKHNLWNSLFVQYDTPTLINDIKYVENNPLFITYSIEDTIDCDDYISVNNAYSRGLLYIDTIAYNEGNNIKYETGYIVNTPSNRDSLNIISSDSHSYVITKADGDYNHTAKQLLERVIRATTVKNTFNSLNISSILNPKKISLNENRLATTIKKDDSLNNSTNLKLSNILNSDQFIMSYKDNNTKVLSNSKLIYGNNLILFKKYISKLITSESSKDKLNRYVKTFTNDINIYIIPENSDVKVIQNTEEYNPLIFTLSVPNQIKFNYGWFTPNTNNMVNFYVDDELRDILDVDLLLSNTKLKSILRIKNYTGNKVFEDTNLQKLNRNYYLITDRSLLSAPWDNNYYRKYINENEYIDIDGHKTGIDDKSFFGSHCMVIHHDYILLNTWEYATANDILTVNYSDAVFNTSDTNQKTTTIIINISSAIFNHFINNDSFNENWVYFKDSQYTGLKNYINNTLSVYYNILSNIEIELYSKDTNPNSIINIVTKKPVDLSTYSKYENYSTKIETKENLNTLTIVLNETTGKNIYPTVKIYKR